MLHGSWQEKRLNEVKVMELKDTIEMMTSSDYKERFKAEYYQLKLRYDKLALMITKWDEGTLEFEPSCSRTLLSRQLHHMRMYMIDLETRAKIEGIDLR